MKVILKRNFYATGDRRFRKSAGKFDAREIPDELCFAKDGKRLLPKDAEIVDGPVPEAPVEAEVTLRDLDVDRAAGDAAAKAAEAEEEEDAAAEFKRKLAQETAEAPATRDKFKRK